MSAWAWHRGGRHAARSLGLLVVASAGSAALVGEDLDSGLTQASSFSQPGRDKGVASRWLDQALTGSPDGDAQQLDGLLDLPASGPLLAPTPAGVAGARNALIPQAVAQAAPLGSDSGPAVLVAAPTTTQKIKRGWTSSGDVTAVQRGNGMPLPERDRYAGAPGGESGLPLRDKLRLTVGFVRENGVWLTVLLATLGVLGLALKAYSRRI